MASDRGSRAPLARRFYRVARTIYRALPLRSDWSWPLKRAFFETVGRAYRGTDLYQGYYQERRWRHGLGVRPEARVGILLERSVEMVVSLLAVLKAGGAYVPLDASHPAGRMRFVLEDAGVDAAVDFGIAKATAQQVTQTGAIWII